VFKEKFVFLASQNCGRTKLNSGIDTKLSDKQLYGLSSQPQNSFLFQNLNILKTPTQILNKLNTKPGFRIIFFNYVIIF